MPQREENPRSGGGAKAEAGGRRVQAPSSGEVGGPLDHESGCRAEFIGCSSLTCGLQTSARRISGSLVARHRKVREDGGSSSSGTEAALASCRGKTQRP